MLTHAEQVTQAVAKWQTAFERYRALDQLTSTQLRTKLRDLGEPEPLLTGGTQKRHTQLIWLVIHAEQPEAFSGYFCDYYAT